MAALLCRLAGCLRPADPQPLAQAVQAGQLTFEDFFMADMNVAPLKIVGAEGVFGSLMMLCVMLPAVYFIPGKDGRGLHEDSLDTLHVRLLSPALPQRAARSARLGLLSMLLQWAQQQLHLCTAAQVCHMRAGVT